MVTKLSEIHSNITSFWELLISIGAFLKHRDGLSPGFPAAMAELNKPDTQYLLRMATGSLGRRRVEFLSVSSINRTVQVVLKM